MPARKDMATIKRIFDLRSEGMGIKTIARNLKIDQRTARKYCYIADDVMSLEPDRIKRAALAMEKYKPMSEADIKRKKFFDKFLRLLRMGDGSITDILNLFGGKKNGRGQSNNKAEIQK